MIVNGMFEFVLVKKNTQLFDSSYTIILNSI